MDISALVMVAAALAGCAVALGLKIGIQGDLVVVLRRALIRLVNREMAMTIPTENLNTYKLWMLDEVEDMVQDGGSGIGVLLLFMVVVVPRAAYRLRFASRPGPKGT